MSEYLDAARRYTAGIDNAYERIAELEQLARDLQKKILDHDDLIDCIELAQEKRSECEEKMEQAAAEIVAFSETPESEEFRQAVSIHRSAKRDCEHYNKLVGRLEAAK